MPPFEFVENPEKPLAQSTLASYKARLNALAKLGYRNKSLLLSNASSVRNFIEENQSKQMRNLYWAAVFYALGRVDAERDNNAKILVDGFQKNYYNK